MVCSDRHTQCRDAYSSLGHLQYRKLFSGLKVPMQIHNRKYRGKKKYLFEILKVMPVFCTPFTVTKLFHLIRIRQAEITESAR